MGGLLGDGQRNRSSRMRIIWSPTAVRDLRQLRRHIAKDDPFAAEHVTALIIAKVNTLPAFPRKGRPGRLEGTRELVIPDTPYFVPYMTRDDGIKLLAVIHGAWQWP